ncbi:putative sulfate permease [Smittium mucronatum]|uniref:Putative sulfate permease n=1 Tax=Smittium mucronatum TaxID=133383 RepID=A0A1R0GLM7_9FUNG|nr:putative sulfate permease [Smittium mucronatum]
MNNLGSLLQGLFPIMGWITRYNSKWFVGDLIAGVTVGIMVIPQGIAYATLANMPPEYGLYTAFIGPIMYTVFGTSKDISIGPTAVISLITGQAINGLSDSGFSPATIGIALAFLSGVINLIMRFFKLTIIIEFISIPVIIGFTSGSALSIMTTQIPALIGLKGINTSESAIRVLINIFKKISGAHYQDIIFGVSTLIFLIILKISSSRLAKINKNFYFIGVLKNALAIVLFTLISYGLYKSSSNFKISVVGTVKKGLYRPRLPDINSTLFSKLIVRAITVTVVVILEHVAIAKALARVDHYEIDSDSEVFSQGIINVVSSFFGSYASTGSFSRSSVNRTSGSQTPFNGVWTTIVVGFSLLVLSKAFFYIPKSTMSAIIMLSVFDLISSPKAVYNLWRVGPIDSISAVVAFIITLTVSVEVGIYAAMGVSVLAVLLKAALPKISLLSDSNSSKSFVDISIFDVGIPNSGIVVIRPEDSLLFLNSSYVKHRIIDIVHSITVFPENVETEGNKFFISSFSSNAHMEARHEFLNKLYQSRKFYNLNNVDSALDLASLENEKSKRNEDLPALRALIIDMSAVTTIDATGVQMLIDINDELLDYSKKQAQFFENLGNGSSPSSSISTVASHDFDIHYANVNPSVLRVLEVSGVIGSVKSFRDRPRTQGSTSKVSLSHGESPHCQGVVTPYNIATNMMFPMVDPEDLAESSKFSFINDNVHRSVREAVNAIYIGHV